jgi:type I restriction enzyme S subunit
MTGERVLTPIADICQVKQGRYLAPGEMAECRTPTTPIPVYGANGILGYTNQVMHKEPVSLVTCRGNGCGLLQWTEGPAWISNNAMACVPKGENDSRYLHYLLFSTDFKDVTTGSAQPQITAGHLNTKTLLLTTNPAEQ